MILMSIAQEFTYAADQAGMFDYPAWINFMVVGISVAIIFAAILSDNIAIVLLWIVVAIFNLLAGIDKLSDETSNPDDESSRTNVIAIEEDYDVEVLSISEPEKSDGLDTQKALLDVRIGSDTVSCTQYIKTKENVYSVYCGEGSTQTPLETLTK